MFSGKAFLVVSSLGLGLGLGLVACTTIVINYPVPDLSVQQDLASHPPDAVALSPETVVMSAQMASGQVGTAVLSDNGDGTTTVKLNTTGGTDTGPQPAHIHTGTCGSNGPIFAPLASLQNGTSTAIVYYGLAVLQGGRYYINIHNSTNASIIQTCGIIQ